MIRSEQEERLLTLFEIAPVILFPIDQSFLRRKKGIQPHKGIIALPA